MNLQSERIIAIHLPIYFEREREKKLREKISSTRRYILSMMVYARIQSYSYSDALGYLQ